MATITSQITPAVNPSDPPDVGYDFRYASLNTWEAARRRDLVAAGPGSLEIAEVFNGGNAAVLGSTVLFNTGWTTDATHYIAIRAAVGYQHQGVWDTNKAYLYQSGNVSVIQSLGKDVHVERMQIRCQRDAVLFYMSVSGSQYVVDSNLIIWETPLASPVSLGSGTVAGATLIFKNNIVISPTSSSVTVLALSQPSTSYVYNNTITSPSSSYCIAGNASTITNNNYIKSNYCYISVGTKGANDATSNGNATTPSLRSIPYSTATFLNVTPGSENLRPVVSQANKLLDNGANLTGSGVTEDIVGTARPQFGAFDIGAFENDIPICWNYTAQYKNSSKLFKASGCGSFPRNLRVPGNVDISTSRMVDDGILINPDEYKVI